MELSHLATFALIAAAFIVIPGPNVLVIVSTSLSAGKARGLQTVVGTSLAMIIQLMVAALATSSVLLLLAEGLLWLKWLGVAYLLYLGISSLYACYRNQDKIPPSALGSLQRGFLVSLTNPKTILFFSAFLPQFVSNEAFYLQQVSLLSVIFWILATAIDMSYATLAGNAKWIFKKRSITRIQEGISGTLYITASGVLVSSRSI